MNIYSVEMWSDKMFEHPLAGEMTHEVSVVCVLGTFEEAKCFCVENSDWGGTFDTHGFYPWHWVISGRILGNEESWVRAAVLNPDGSDYFEPVFEKGLLQSMTLNEYQNKAMATAIYPSGFTYPALGLASEAGEVAGKIKKLIRDQLGGPITDEQLREVAEELGDTFWYVAAMAYELGYTLEELACMNITKLKDRKDRGVIGGSGDTR